MIASSVYVAPVLCGGGDFNFQNPLTLKERKKERKKE